MRRWEWVEGDGGDGEDEGDGGDGDVMATEKRIGPFWIAEPLERMQFRRESRGVGTVLTVLTAAIH
nr:MAG: hypothetical protein EDM05_07095 [Leptolyngbya sp. IPPAS B-1204]